LDPWASVWANDFKLNFYAGVPLRSDAGQDRELLAVTGRDVRTLDEERLDTLKRIARLCAEFIRLSAPLRAGENGDPSAGAAVQTLHERASGENPVATWLAAGGSTRRVRPIARNAARAGPTMRLPHDEGDECTPERQAQGGGDREPEQRVFPVALPPPITERDNVGGLGPPNCACGRQAPRAQ
jgi:hypothetical protein